jgi:hypothetical protein
MKTPEVINLPVTPAAWNYIRRAVGMCPHDEVHPLIVQLEAEVNAQVTAQNETVPTGPQDTMHPSFGGVTPLGKPNGSGHAAEQDLS